MHVGILLLTEANQYIVNGTLPKRPTYDKGLLMALSKGQKCIAGPATYVSLPKTLKERTSVSGFLDHDLNLGIKTMYTSPPHLLIVIRSTTVGDGGKVFDLSRWTRAVRQGDLEMWMLDEVER